MKRHFHTFLERPLAKPALIVPILIMVIFSVFTLTSPADPERTAAAVHMGVVNKDTGLVMPPVKISERLLQGAGSELPVTIEPFESAEAAREALERGDLSFALIFPEDFSQKAFAGEKAEFEFLSAPFMTVAEVQIAQQMQRMLPMAMSAGVASMRLAMAQGQMPTGEMPVAATVTDLSPPLAMAGLQAPFVMLYTTWLASLVGAILMVLATRGRVDTGTVALTRTLFPVIVTGLASLCLSIVVGATVDWAAILPVWSVVWPSALALTWFNVGIISVLGLWTIALLLPLAFYQSAIGGVMYPAAAAPQWLQSLTSWAGLDRLGAAYRGALHGVDLPYPLILMGAIAVIGLVLIWIRSAFPAKTAA